MKRCLAFNAALLLCLLGALTLRPVEGLAAPARERILLFDATAVFDSTGTMEVTERITVHAAGQRIVRGIFRKLPRMWQREDGKRFALEYGIVAVQRDGKPEPYTVRKSDRDLTLYIGNEGAKLAPGTHEYALTYTVSNHFSRFPDWDELYWNVTGNAWDFPIDKARFRLLFRPSKGAEPVPMPMRSLDLYTGSQGERGKNARQLSNGIIETTKALARGQGLTIAWSWPRSLLADVPAPREYSHWKALLLPTSRTLFFWILPLWMAGYFAFLYFTKRPGPMPAIIPLFKAPDGLSPGSLRYALKGSYDGTAFAADLLHLVAKGAVSLNAQSVPPTLRKDFGVRYRGGVLQAEEQQALDRLFAQSDSVNLTTSNRRQITEARKVLSRHCSDMKRVLFQSVIKYRVLGVAQVLALLFFFARHFASEGLLILIFLAAFTSIWIPIVYLFTRTVIQEIDGIKTLLARLPVLLFLVPFWWAIVAMWYFLLPPVLAIPGMPEGAAGVLPATVLVMVVGNRLLPRRTAEGLRRLAIAKGLAMYLGTAERDRFAALYPPAESVQHFEALLPYALALDEGKTWANRFARFMEETGAFSQIYTGDPWDTVTSFRTGTVRATTVARSFGYSGGSGGGFSGSGSSGRGSSGGGAGGGGGGGW